MIQDCILAKDTDAKVQQKDEFWRLGAFQKFSTSFQRFVTEWEKPGKIQNKCF